MALHIRLMTTWAVAPGSVWPWLLAGPSMALSAARTSLESCLALHVAFLFCCVASSVHPQVV